jgi:hypothetical protein
MLLYCVIYFLLEFVEETHIDTVLSQEFGTRRRFIWDMKAV